MLDYEKDVQIVPVPNSSLWKIRFTGGGEVPDPLKGLFTSPTVARETLERAQLTYKRRIPKSKTQ